MGWLNFGTGFRISFQSLLFLKESSMEVSGTPTREKSKCRISSPVQPPRTHHWSVNRKCTVKYFLFYNTLSCSPEIKILFLLLCNKLNFMALTTSHSNHLWGINVLGAAVPPLTQERQCDVVKLIFSGEYSPSPQCSWLQDYRPFYSTLLYYTAKIWINLCAINVFFYQVYPLIKYSFMWASFY